MKCPVCELEEKHQENVPEEPRKTKCKGCGTIFFDKSK